jgi:hypothetical protein
MSNPPPRPSSRFFKGGRLHFPGRNRFDLHRDRLSVLIGIDGAPSFRNPWRAYKEDARERKERLDCRAMGLLHKAAS